MARRIVGRNTEDLVCIACPSGPGVLPERVVWKLSISLRSSADSFCLTVIAGDAVYPFMVECLCPTAILRRIARLRESESMRAPSRSGEWF